MKTVSTKSFKISTQNGNRLLQVLHAVTKARSTLGLVRLSSLLTGIVLILGLSLSSLALSLLFLLVISVLDQVTHDAAISRGIARAVANLTILDSRCKERLSNSMRNAILLVLL